MSNLAIDMILRSLARGFTPHGMRSSFGEWAGAEIDCATAPVEPPGFDADGQMEAAGSRLAILRLRLNRAGECPFQTRRYRNA